MDAAEALPPTVSAIRDDALADGDTVDLLERIQRREVSPAEVRAAARARIRDCNPALNAVVCELDEIPVRDPGGPSGRPFAGVPLPIKDTDDIAGYPTSWGSQAFPAVPARGTSIFVSQLMDLGFVPIAKTTMPEFGLTASTQSRRFGDTRNPWDTGRSVGGSSGGSAALVAAGATTMAHANDGGGSTRIPASTCGLVGLKPSRGRLIDRPEMARTPINLFTQGVVTRSVRDTALFYAAAEQEYRNPGLPPVGHVRDPITERLRIAIVTEGLSGIAVDPQVQRAVESAAALCASLGHEVQPVANPYSAQTARDFLRYWSLLALFFQRMGQAMFGRGFDSSKIDAFTLGLADMARGQLERIPLSLHRLRRLAHDGGPLFDRFDIVLGPTLGHPPPTLSWLAPDVPFRTHMVRLLRYVTATPLENVAGVPAISLPLSRTRTGLPVGVQFSAGLGQERRLLGLALELEAAAPWPRTPTA